MVNKWYDLQVKVLDRVSRGIGHHVLWSIRADVRESICYPHGIGIGIGNTLSFRLLEELFDG